MVILYVVQMLLSSCLLLVWCHLLLCRIVRLISPNLNYFIIFGAILMYLSIIFFVFPTTDLFLVTFACHVSENAHVVIMLSFHRFIVFITYSSVLGLRLLATSCAMERLLLRCGESTLSSTILKFKSQNKDKGY